MQAARQAADADKWRCGTCYLKHAQDVIICPGCENAKPGSEDAAKALKEGAAKKDAAATADKVAKAGITFGAKPAAGAKVREQDSPICIEHP